MSLAIQKKESIQEILNIYTTLIINEYGNQDLTRACITYLRGNGKIPDIYEIWRTENGKFTRYGTYTLDAEWWSGHAQ